MTTRKGTPSDPQIVTILGRRWRLEFARFPRDADHEGTCDPPENAGKRIRIDRSLVGQRKLETLIHEVLHAADWHKSEEWVEEVANDLARILYRLGYREADE